MAVTAFRVPQFALDAASDACIERIRTDPTRRDHLYEVINIWRSHLDELLECYKLATYDEFLRPTATVEAFLMGDRDARTPVVELEFWRRLQTQLSPYHPYVVREEVASATKIARNCGESGTALANKFGTILRRVQNCYDACGDAVKHLGTIEEYVTAMEEADTLQPVVDTMSPLFTALRHMWVSSKVYGTSGSTANMVYDSEGYDVVPRGGPANFVEVLLQLAACIERTCRRVLSPVAETVVPTVGGNHLAKRRLLEGREACLVWKEQLTVLRDEMATSGAHPAIEISALDESNLTESTDYIHDRCAEWVDVLDFVGTFAGRIKVLRNPSREDGTVPPPEDLIEWEGMLQELVDAPRRLNCDWTHSSAYPTWEVVYEQAKVRAERLREHLPPQLPPQ